MSKPEYELFDKNTQAIIYNYQQAAIQRMLDFDYVCGRETPSVACIVNPARAGLHKCFFGGNQVLIPMYRTITEACENHPNVDVMINFASSRSSYQTTVEALNTPQLKTIAVIAEGIPERKSKEMAALALKLGKVIIGPATVGGLKAGAFKIGNTGGTVENIITSKLHRCGSVGFVSKSGGMSNEMYNLVSQNSNGIYEGIAIGGDMYPGSTLLQHLLRFEANPEIKILCCLGEVGGTDEYAIVEAIKENKLTKPLIMWVTGTCAKVFPTSVQFGHAGAKAGSEAESADAKNAALKEAGAHVPQSFDEYGEKIREVFQDLKQKGVIVEKPEIAPVHVPMDYKQALKEGIIRKDPSFINTISDDRGEELIYLNKTISQAFKEDIGVGGVVGLLWFKRDLPPYAKRFIDMVIMVTADHGPAVSGAHNAIVASRAGKDMISSLVSGLLTIGPRFGGAIDGAAQMFYDAYKRGLSPEEFVVEMKKKGVNIQGIGHRIKSVQNPDVRVQIIKEYVQENFKSHELLDYALEVEKVTTSKKNNLILNVDGCIGICFVDLMLSCGQFSEKEVQEYIDLGVLNGLFVVGRSIGLIGHVLDQKRLKQGLYRHPWDDIAYMLPDE
ncbi:MAG TPA: ATP citrate synthase [Euryarchaeota archaeon]|nr:ATP citrate synthase [Euryarchaeota archaeon]